MLNLFGKNFFWLTNLGSGVVYLYFTPFHVMDHAAAIPVSDLIFPSDLNRKIRTAGLYVE